jgi:hypothetical protein
MTGMTIEIARPDMAFARPDCGSGHTPPRFAARPLCARCDRARPIGRPTVIDVWPGGLSGAMDRGMYRLRQIRWARALRRGGRYLANVACVGVLSLGVVCVSLLLVSPS